MLRIETMHNQYTYVSPSEYDRQSIHYTVTGRRWGGVGWSWEGGEFVLYYTGSAERDLIAVPDFQV